MKRVNIVEYLDLSEQLGAARAAAERDTTKAGSIYFATYQLRQRLQSFIADDNGFGTSKHAAQDLLEEIAGFYAGNILDNNSPPQLDIEKLDRDVPAWTYRAIGAKVETFKNVFSTECRGVEIYSVGQISIYRTSSLVAKGSDRIPIEYAELVPDAALGELDNAGKCLAFDLATACGFHALRAVELMILQFILKFGGKAAKLKTWYDYIAAVQKLIDGPVVPKPSQKVAAMLDRMRVLDRNPLMHPRDTLDVISADMLFNLAVITILEMARDIEKNQATLPSPAATLELIGDETADEDAENDNAAEPQKANA